MMKRNANTKKVMVFIKRIDICLTEKSFIHDQMDGFEPKGLEAGKAFIDCLCWSTLSLDIIKIYYKMSVYTLSHYMHKL